ncbi:MULTISPECIES: hypothetical protein [unclassified Streptomyces]
MVIVVWGVPAPRRWMVIFVEVAAISGTALGMHGWATVGRPTGC